MSGLSPPPQLETKRILRLWWPLAASWLLMGAELPLFTIFVARMADPEVHLAAYGAIVFPVSLLIEAPIIMLLSASTALSRDRASYWKLHRFMVASSLLLTLVHVAVAFTPLFDRVAAWMSAPEVIVEPARIGLRIMTPWTAAIAYRRFQQGVLIRFERSRAVVLGTLVRLVAGVLLFALGLAHGELPGIVVGASAVVGGVVAEAVLAGLLVRPIVRELGEARPGVPPLDRGAFLRFYLPLAVTPLITLVMQPIAAAAMGRMPNPLVSLAAWPAVHGLVFLARSAGFATNEVVVTLLDEPGAVQPLRRFTRRLATGTSVALVLLAWTPLGRFWFGTVSGLSPELLEVSTVALWAGLLMPATQALQSFTTGALVHGRATRAVTEATILYMILASLGLLAGVLFVSLTGIYTALMALTFGGIVQTLWLERRSRGLLRRLAHGD